jgi:hypothetical protein
MRKNIYSIKFGKKIQARSNISPGLQHTDHFMNDFYHPHPLNGTYRIQGSKINKACKLA